MTHITARTSKAITVFSFLATILVVMCHTDDVMPPESRSILVRYFGGSFSDANVSNFFFLSGFLLGRHFGETGWWRKAVVSRLRTLAVPYIAWCIVYFLIFGGVLSFAGEIHNAYAESGGIVLALRATIRTVKSVFGLGLLILPSDSALWYIKTLFYFVFFSLIAPPLLLSSKRRFLISVSVILTVFVLVHGFYLGNRLYFLSCFHLIGFATFLAGAYCAMHNIDSLPERLLRFHPLVPLCIWGGTSAVCMIASAHLNDIRVLLGPINIATSIFCLVWISFAVDWRPPKAITQCMFFIYAAHLAVLRILSRLLVGVGEAASLLVFAMVLLATITICIFGAHAIQWTCPRLAAILTGGRSERKV